MVICDRYYLSSYAYQMGNDCSNLEWLRTINSRCVTPDLTLFLRTSHAVCEKRMAKNRWYQELYEKPEILHQVAKNYETAITALRQEMAIEVIDGNADEETVFGQVLLTIKRSFPEMFPWDLPLFGCL